MILGDSNIYTQKTRLESPNAFIAWWSLLESSWNEHIIQVMKAKKYPVCFFYTYIYKTWYS